MLLWHQSAIKTARIQHARHVLWHTTEEISTKLEEEAPRLRKKQELLSRKSHFRTGKCVTFKHSRGFIVFLFSNQNSLGLLCSEGPPTLCQPFRGHFRFFSMKPSCLSGLWTLLCPIFRPSMISQLSASCRGPENVVWAIKPPWTKPKIQNTFLILLISMGVRKKSKDVTVENELILSSDWVK